MLEHHQDALFSTFVRDVEGVAEGGRRRLVESWEFLPREVFMVLPKQKCFPIFMFDCD